MFEKKSLIDDSNKYNKPSIGIEEIKPFIRRRISHAEDRYLALKAEYGENPSDTHNYYGGQSVGYWLGMMNAYETVLMEIDGQNV